MPYFDAHTHAHFAAFAEDSDAVIRRALDADVWLVNVGTQKDTSRGAVETANKYKEGVFAAIGLHPVHTDRAYHDPSELGAALDGKGFTARGEEFDPAYYEELGRDPKVVAIGECGLDYFRIEGSAEEIAAKKERQKAAFLAQIELAGRLKKPLMIHCRDAFPDLIDILRTTDYALRTDPGVIHFFTGTPEHAEQLLALGFSFTFGGVITFTRDYDAAIALIPPENILSETDAPYVAPVPYRGKRNEPAYVVETVKKLAELKGVVPEAMRDIIFENARRVFRLPA